MIPRTGAMDGINIVCEVLGEIAGNLWNQPGTAGELFQYQLNRAVVGAEDVVEDVGGDDALAQVF